MSSKGPAATGTAVLKLIIPAGKATAGPPIGPALGQKGVKAMDFCKQFNEASKAYTTDVPLRCRILVRPDRTFTFQVRPPATGWLLKRASGAAKASSEPGARVAEMSAKYVWEIARVKREDPLLARLPLRSVFSMVLATARKTGFHIF